MIQQQQDLSVPVLAIDGPAKAGKGTVRTLVAEALGFHQLDSGKLYRAAALVAFQRRLDEKREQWVGVAKELRSILTVEGNKVFLGDDEVTTYLKSPQIGQLGSKIATDPAVRNELDKICLTFRKAPGLVADGRDMCYVFQTPFRYFLTASPAVRARRQVIEEGISPDASYFKHKVDEALASINERDQRDSTREASPLLLHPEALVICTDELTAEQVADKIVTDFRQRQ